MSLLNEAVVDLEARSKQPSAITQSRKSNKFGTLVLTVFIIVSLFGGAVWFVPGSLRESVIANSSEIEGLKEPPVKSTVANNIIEATTSMLDKSAGGSIVMADADFELSVPGTDNNGNTDNTNNTSNTDPKFSIFEPEQVATDVIAYKEELDQGDKKAAINKPDVNLSEPKSIQLQLKNSDEQKLPEEVVHTEPAALQQSVATVNAKIKKHPPEVAIFKSAKQREKEMLHSLHKLSQQGDWGSVESLAVEAIAGEFKHSSEIAAQLLNALIEQNKIDYANQVWLERSTLGEKHTLARAKVVAAQFGGGAAIKYLEQSKPLLESELAMYAGLLQQQKYFSKAEANYLQLINLAPKNGVYWLGMALSLDQQLKVQTALSAYQRALNLGGHNRSVETFIVDRVNTLAQQTQVKTELSQW